ncbi:MAG: two-component system sensor histidine kinase YesM [Spirochaetales bacterium]
MTIREVINQKYKRNLYLRYLGISLVPFLFFLLLGSFAIYLSQRYVTDEISRLSARNLGQVQDTFELVLSEADAFALSMATDPAFNQTALQVLEKEIRTLEDTRIHRNFIDSLMTATNVRRYLHSLYIFNKHVPGKIITNTDGIVDVTEFYDTEWISQMEEKKGELGFWLRRRSVPLFSSAFVSRDVLTLYRNILEPYSLETQGMIAVNIKLDYLVSLLSTVSNTGQEDFMVIHPSLGTLVSSSNKWDPARDILQYLTYLPDGKAIQGSTFSVLKDGKEYVVSILVSNRYPLLYVSLIPNDVYFHLSNELLRLTIIFSGLALVLGVGAIVYLTRRNFRYVEYICDTIEHAANGRPTPLIQKQSRKGSFYELTHEIVRTFLERDYLKLRHTTLELQALQSQMNPHFLFNTLTSISLRAMAFTGGPNDVTKMVDLLSRILSYSLESPGMDVRLKDEVQFTRYYLKIQAYRYPGRFQVRWEVQNDTLECKVVKLLLQPLAENSLYHGVGSGLNRMLHIHIRSWKQDGTLCITVEDDGVGMSKERLSELLKLIEGPSSDDHIGLVNTVRRLKLAFGESVGIHIQSSPGKGMKVEFRIPLLSEG